MDHHWHDNIFATCGERLDVWNEERTEPFRSYPEVNGLTSVRFNPVEVLMETTKLKIAFVITIKNVACIRRWNVPMFF